MRADVDLHQHIERYAGLRRRGGYRADDGRVVGEHTDRRSPRKAREARELGRRDDFVGDENVANAGLDKRSGLVHFLATDTDCAVRNLLLGDVRTFVRLGVWPECQAGSAHRIGHELEIALEGVQVDDECRRVDGRNRIPGPGWHPLHGRIRSGRSRGLPGNERGPLSPNAQRDASAMRRLRKCRESLEAAC